jgi:predicted SAM-dependent methyltransferase
VGPKALCEEPTDIVYLHEHDDQTRTKLGGEKIVPGSMEQPANEQRLPPDHKDGIKRVQVGCGPHHLRQEWWNTDLRPFDGIDEAMDATLPWRWKNILDFVYAEHFIEHLAIEDGLKFLVEAGNALKVGGKIRLTTPSLEWVVRTHFRVDRLDQKSRLEDTFKINRAFHGWGHQFLYSGDMLHEIVSQAGFEDVTFFRWGRGSVPELNELERHPSDIPGNADVIIVEGTRGRQIPAFSVWAGHWLRNCYTRWSHQKH